MVRPRLFLLGALALLVAIAVIGAAVSMTGSPSSAGEMPGDTWANATGAPSGERSLAHDTANPESQIIGPDNSTVIATGAYAFVEP